VVVEVEAFNSKEHLSLIDSVEFKLEWNGWKAKAAMFQRRVSTDLSVRLFLG
jgi:hypothetical protein